MLSNVAAGIYISLSLSFLISLKILFKKTLKMCASTRKISLKLISFGILSSLSLSLSLHVRICICDYILGSPDQIQTLLNLEDIIEFSLDVIANGMYVCIRVCIYNCIYL